MRKVGSIFRFTLVMIGSFFLTVVILVVNAFASGNGRSKNGHAAPPAPLPQGTNDVKTAGKAQTGIVVRLKDGSRITGEPRAGSVSIQTSSGKVDIPLNQVRRLLFHPDNGTVTAYLAKGDILSGTLVSDAFEVMAEFGKISIKTVQIDFITNPAVLATMKPQEETVDELMRELTSDTAEERRRAVQGLTAKGQAVVPKLKESLSKNSPSLRAGIVEVLSALGWYVTRAGVVEKMSESKEFRDMMRKRLPEMHAE